MNKVLVIEDDPEIVDLLEIHLKDLSCELLKSPTGEEGLSLVKSQPLDLVILAIMLPGIDGMEVCRRIRGEQINVPVLMLTAKSEEIDKVLGLEIGADDYLTKPFSIREFIARVKAIFRRSQMMQKVMDNPDGNIIEAGELTINIEMRKVLLGERKIDLSPKEFELLVLLASNPGKSYNRSRLLNLVWGYDFEGYEHTVNSHINRLRAKIEPDMADPTYILTTWGVGYKFNEEI
jgi:DNA-binding response OmpR family regulator